MMHQFVVWRCNSGAVILVERSEQWMGAYGFHKHCRHLRLANDFINDKEERN